MSPHTYATPPAATGEQRKFINPTGGFVGANVFGPDGKPTAVAVEPGGEVWLTEAEERMTAEAPRAAGDNPFTKEWDEPVEWDPFGEVARSVRRHGTLVLSEDPPRPIASSRYVPARNGHGADSETITGAPEVPDQPPVEGQPSPDEVIGTPEAPDANARAIAEREPTAEQATAKARAIPTR